MSEKQNFRVRLMSPLGRYPGENLQSAYASLIVSAEICFSIVQEKGEVWDIPEMECFTEAELTLFASILLAGEAGRTYIYPYPTAVNVVLEAEKCPSIAECTSRLLADFPRYSENHQTARMHEPSALGGQPYEFVSKGNYSNWIAILTRLKTASPVTLRGLSCLIKSQMASKYREFGEASCIYLWIALDAAHSLILKTLHETGNPSPTSADAARYFEKITGYDTGWEKFFEDDYEKRISAIHPDNRFGAEAIPRLTADDFFELNGELVALFHFFVMLNW